MLRSLTIVLGVLLFGTAVPAVGRIDFRVTHGDQRLLGAEVCFLPTPIQPRNLADSLFRSGDINCLPADQLLELPAGAWLYFARHRSGFISDYRPLVSMPRDEPAENFKDVQVRVVPAATVRVAQLLSTLKGNERLAVIAGSQWAGTIVLPLVPGEDSFLVPAGAVFVVAIVADQRPIRLSRPMKLAAAESISISSIPQHRDGVHDVIAWISFPTLFEAHYAAELARLERPRVQLIAGKQTFEPIFKPNSVALAEALLVFKDVPLASAHVRLDGDFWMPDEVLSVGADPVEMLDEPLSTEPAAAVRATITLPPGRDRACHSDEKTASVTLLSCDAGAADTCATLQTVSVQRDQSVTFGGLRRGRYVIEFDPGVAGAKQRRELAGEIGVVSSIAIAPSYFSLYGNVLLNGAPVSRMLDFWRRGTAVSDAAEGRYAVTVSEMPPNPRLGFVRVINCEDERDVYMHFAAAAPKQGERFDIVIPDNSIEVKLRDAGGAGGIPGVVRLAAYEDDASDAMRFGQTYQTDASGNAVIAHVTTEAPLSVCGEANGYESRCVPRFRIGASDARKIELDLRRKMSGSRGHVNTAAPIEYGRLWWVSDDGAITESVVVEPNGDFSYEREHAPREHIVIASGTQPLAAFPSPVTAADALLELTYPTGRRRDLVVRLDDAGVDQAMLGMIIGNLIIPTAAFAHHQNFHGAQIVVDKSKPLRIPDVQESAPITIVLGPDGPSAVEHLPSGTDWMSVAAFVLSRPRLTAAESGQVTFRH